MQNSIQWMRKNCPGFVWGYVTKAIEPQEDMIVCLEPDDSFADIIGSEEVISHNQLSTILYISANFLFTQVPKGTVDLPRKWPEYSTNHDLYPPRVMVALQRSSEKMKYTISIYKGITGECTFTLVSPKLVAAESKGWSYPHTSFAIVDIDRKSVV